MGDHLPILLKVRGGLAVVVGGGQVAARKARTLADAGARVRVISPAADSAIAELAAAGLEWNKREYQDGDLAGARLAVAATDSPAVNARVADEARARGIPVNLVDDPAGSDYHVPSFFEDGPLLIAVSTGGASPAVARTLRRMIQSFLGDSFGQALELIRDFRETQVKHRIALPADRVTFWETAVSPELLDQARAGRLDEVRRMLEEALERFEK